MEQNPTFNFGTEYFVVTGSADNLMEVSGSNSGANASGSRVGSNNGHEVEVKTVNFSLKPLPSRANKSRKKVPDEAKDATYWANRVKNANATRQSRLANGLKKEKALARCKFLEKACAELESKIAELSQEDENKDEMMMDESG